MSTIQLASASAFFGHATRFISTSLVFDESHNEKEWYQKYSDNSLDRSKMLLREARTRGVALAERAIVLDDLLAQAGPACVPIVLVDWNVVRGTPERGYQGHFVPVVGYDAANVYVHDPEQPARGGRGTRKGLSA